MTEQEILNQFYALLVCLVYLARCHFEIALEMFGEK